MRNNLDVIVGSHLLFFKQNKTTIAIYSYLFLDCAKLPFVRYQTAATFEWPHKQLYGTPEEQKKLNIHKKTTRNNKKLE